MLNGVEVTMRTLENMRDLEVWREAAKLIAQLDEYSPEVQQFDPEKWWLEDYFPSEKVTFQGRAAKLRVGINLRYMSHKNNWGSYKMGSWS